MRPGHAACATAEVSGARAQNGSTVNPPPEYTRGALLPGGPSHVVRQAVRLRWLTVFWAIALGVAVGGARVATVLGAATVLMGLITAGFVGLARRRDGPGPRAFLVALELVYGVALGLAARRTGGVFSPLLAALLCGPALAGLLAFDRRLLYALIGLQAGVFGIGASGTPIPGEAGPHVAGWTAALLTAGAYLHAVIVEHDRVARLTIFEPRTGLYSREFMLSRLEDACHGVGGLRPPFSVLMLDLDDFKQINDRFGHPAGDRALSETAYAIRKNLRTFDLAGRFGGEEFIILLSNTLEDDAVSVAERLCQAIAQRSPRAEPDGPPIPLSASIGVAAYGPGRDNPADVIAAADRALYWAKQRGKNRAESASRVPAELPASAERRRA